MFEEKIVNFHCLLYHVFKLRVMRALLYRNLALYHVTASPGVNVLDYRSFDACRENNILSETNYNSAFILTPFP